jgi:hypothetical protein
MFLHRDRKLQVKRQGYQKVKQEVAKGGAAQKDTDEGKKSTR